MDGLQVLSRVRSRNPNLLVVLLTARDQEEDHIRGLDLGADDYLVKPISVGELAARIRAHLRRAKIDGGGLLVHGSLKMDLPAHRATLNDVPLELTKREWLLLATLARNAGRIVSKQNLLEITGSGEDQASYNSVEVYMSRLRAKLEKFKLNIRTVRGFGYMLDDSPDG
jgi:two-component system OmpR family response regulator